MNDLLFYALLAALLYYFFIYLPAQKSRPTPLKPSTDNRPEIPTIHFPLRPSTQKQATQTEAPVMEYEPGPEIINCPEPQFEPSPTLKHLQDQNTALLQDQAQQEKTITELNKSYKKLEGKFKQVKEELTKLSQKPNKSKPTPKSDEQVEQALDQLIKNINKLSQELCP